MTSEHLKKKAERFFLERFVEASGLAVEIEDEREEPDFLVRFGGRIVGVEVTRVYISDEGNRLPQAQESISDRIVSRARRMYESIGGWPAHVSVCFASRQDLQRINRDDTAEELAGVVKSMGLGEWKRVDWRPEDLGSLSRVVAFVQALGVPAPEMAHWTVARAGWAAPLTIEHLQSRIRDKAARLPEYQRNVRENWLLVYADGMKPSQLFEVREGFDSSKVVSPFDRTYFYCHPERAIVELG